MILNICTNKKYRKLHTERNFSERNFAKLKKSQICGNKLHKKLVLRREIVADDKIKRDLL